MGGRGQGGGRELPTGLVVLLIQGATLIRPPAHPEASPPQELEDPQMKSNERGLGLTTSKLGGFSFPRKARCFSEESGPASC